MKQALEIFKLIVVNEKYRKKIVKSDTKTTLEKQNKYYCISTAEKPQAYNRENNQHDILTKCSLQRVVSSVFTCSNK